MDRMRARCPRSAAQALCCTIFALVGLGCEDAARDEPVEGAVMTSSFVPAAPMAPRVDASVASPIATPLESADASTVAANGVASRDSVDANGVRGALVDAPYLADLGDGTKSLIAVDWEIPPGEFYLCGRVTVPDDVYFGATYPVNPLGTHHTVVTVQDKPDAPDGVRKCDISEVGRRSIGGSGVGTGGGKMPPGIALKAERGNQIILNLHLFNTTDGPLRGRSGSRVETIAPSQVTSVADGVTVGPLKLNVPPGPSVQTGVCTVEYDYTIFRVFPHMHEMGRYMKVVAKRALGDEVVLYDGPYDFVHQFTFPVDPPLKMAKGDKIEIACTYMNSTTQELHFGESSKDEMCVAGVVRFPGGGKSTCPY
jgi:Copper type II ascorbate-dependent monooxygenase, C-terminal domain